ncbi:hypothetical protein GCK32_021661 [Trichostrongylus colubriformis]|uniref:C-type lectin domain-containing protein n=1 Tax=Trichostrongylus colubriformis TaxID=6319 RepID=A0AAN8G135_TRICO
MSFKNVFAGLVMLLCVITVGCDLNITAFRIEKAKKFEWIYYSINGGERGLKVLPPKFGYNHEAEKMCRDEGAHLASIHSKEENDFIYGAFLFLSQQECYFSERRHPSAAGSIFA